MKQHKQITVIDDNPDNRFLLQAVLRGQYRVVEYSDGASALAGMNESAPDLVLLDISLPGMDGPAVLAHMREVASLTQVPVVALTAHAMAGDRERFLELGFDAYVAKPIVDWQAFKSMLGTLIEAVSCPTSPS